MKDKEKHMSVLSEQKMKTYLEYFKDKKFSIFCDCGKIVEVELVPYYYDEEENDVYLASICPNCGNLIITKE